MLLDWCPPDESLHILRGGPNTCAGDGHAGAAEQGGRGPQRHGAAHHRLHGAPAHLHPLRHGPHRFVSAWPHTMLLPGGLTSQNAEAEDWDASLWGAAAARMCLHPADRVGA